MKLNLSICGKQAYTLPVLLLGTILPGQALGLSSIVSIRTAHEIVIAADSKATAGNDLAIHFSLCKIHKFGDVFFTNAGFMFSPTTGFKVEAVAKEACVKNTSLAQKVAYFESAIIKPMMTHLELEKRSNYEVFLREYEGREMLQVIFAGFENGVPVVMYRTFKTETSSSGQTAFFLKRKHDCPGDCKGDLSYRVLGEQEAIYAFLDKQPHFWKSGLSFAEIAKFFVMLEVKDKGEFVGPPVDILRLTKDGAKWVQKKPECPEVQSATILPYRPRASLGWPEKLGIIAVVAALASGIYYLFVKRRFLRSNI